MADKAKRDSADAKLAARVKQLEADLAAVKDALLKHLNIEV